MYAENTVYDTANVKKSNAYQTFQLSRDSWVLFFSDMDISASSQNHGAVQQWPLQISPNE